MVNPRTSITGSDKVEQDQQVMMGGGGEGCKGGAQVTRRLAPVKQGKRSACERALKIYAGTAINKFHYYLLQGKLPRKLYFN